MQGKGCFVHMTAAGQGKVVVQGKAAVQGIAVVQGTLVEKLAVDQDRAAVHAVLDRANWEKHRAVPVADPGRVN
jgi:hypothetical protein